MQYRFVPLALAILMLGVGTAARADDAGKPAPTPEPGAAAQSACIKQDVDWTGEGRRIMFVVTLSNACERRLKCRIFANVSNAMGAAQGRGTLTLPAAAHGVATKKSWSMRVKMSGGTAQTARECRAL